MKIQFKKHKQVESLVFRKEMFYVLKTFLLDVSSKNPSRALKQRVLGGISDTFIGSVLDGQALAYYHIGISFSLGNFRVPSKILGTDQEEQVLVRLQVWNFNEGLPFARHINAIGSNARFAILTWNQSESAGLEILESTIRSFRVSRPGISIGVIMLLTSPAIPCDRIFTSMKAFLAQQHLDPCPVSSIDEMMAHMFEQSNSLVHDNAASTLLMVLPIHSPDEIAQKSDFPPAFYQDIPQSPRIEMPLPRQGTSSYLRDMLKSQGYGVSRKNSVNLVKGRYLFQVNLHTASVAAKHLHCMNCQFSGKSCHVSKTSLCIVPYDYLASGHATPDLNLTNQDVFVLAVIYAIENNALPHSVKRQIPLILPCIKGLHMFRFLRSCFKRSPGIIAD